MTILKFFSVIITLTSPKSQSYVKYHFRFSNSKMMTFLLEKIFIIKSIQRSLGWNHRIVIGFDSSHLSDFQKVGGGKPRNPGSQDHYSISLPDLLLNWITRGLETYNTPTNKLLLCVLCRVQENLVESLLCAFQIRREVWVFICTPSVIFGFWPRNISDMSQFLVFLPLSGREARWKMPKFAEKLFPFPYETSIVSLRHFPSMPGIFVSQIGKISQCVAAIVPQFRILRECERLFVYEENCSLFLTRHAPWKINCDDCSMKWGKCLWHWKAYCSLLFFPRRKGNILAFRSEWEKPQI